MNKLLLLVEQTRKKNPKIESITTKLTHLFFRQSFPIFCHTSSTIICYNYTITYSHRFTIYRSHTLLQKQNANIVHCAPNNQYTNAHNKKSSDEHSMTPPPPPPPPSMMSSAGYIQSNHMSPTHHMQHPHLNPAITYHQALNHQQPGQLSSVNANAQSNASNASGGSVAVSTGYPEEFYSTQDFNELGQNEHYIYVTYPPELKRRLLERYGREIYSMLLKKDFPS